jgi:plastocyanin/truncated hemoglobin YjbI
MKVLLLVCLLVCCIAPMVSAQCSLNGTTIWQNLGANDAARLAAVQFVTDRAFGLLLGDECLGHLFRASPSNLNSQFVAFLATAFGGNINGTNNNFTGIVFRERGITTNPIITSLELNALLQALSNTHQPLGFSQQEQNAFKAAVAAVLTSAGLPACVISAAGALLTATDPVVVGNGGTLSRPCQASTQRVSWRNPTASGINVSISLNQTVCFDWADALQHTVNQVNTPSQILGGFGAGAAGNAISITNATSCVSRGLTAGACYLGTGYSYCIRFFNAGAWTFNCAIHGNSMIATVQVAATSGTTTGTPGGTTGGSTTGGSSAASTLRPGYIF